jgi:hypothetical protein
VSIPAPPAPPRPTNASPPSVNFTSIAGIYNNYGYGSVELCLVSPNIAAASHSCKAMASNASTILPGAIDPSSTIPTYLAEWNGPWMSHIKLTHWDGDLFNVSALSSHVSTHVKVVSSPLTAWGCGRQQVIYPSLIGRLGLRTILALA